MINKLLHWLLGGRPLLVRNSILDTVYGFPGFASLEHIPRRPYRHCAHANSRDYVRIDHRAGPGSFADSYAGKVCTDCGEVLEERPTD